MTKPGRDGHHQDFFRGGLDGESGGQAGQQAGKQEEAAEFIHKY
jgi:hypothetical protein